MGENTKIEWADHTFNPVIGCEKVSEACKHCYAETWADRWRPGSGLWDGERQRTSAAVWREPARWDREAMECGTRRRVFCASLSDVFEDHPVWSEVRPHLWALIRETPHLDWLLLTKRPENIARMLPDDWGDGYHNVWLGVTVENQRRADERIPALLSVPARVRFLSCEPLLGPVQLGDALGACRCTVEPMEGAGWHAANCPATRPRIDWVITGGESGGGARPSHPDWFRALRDQCEAAYVPFLFKQWGEWREAIRGDVGRGFDSVMLRPDGSRIGVCDAFDPVLGDALVVRRGKARAGRELDGRTWDEVPTVGGVR